jgi:ketosteroid isomerase-like protein
MLSERVRTALAAIDAGDTDDLRELFTEDAQWLGVPVEGLTPV